jgi:hypothetical protein
MPICDADSFQFGAAVRAESSTVLQLRTTMLAESVRRCRRRRVDRSRGRRNWRRRRCCHGSPVWGIRPGGRPVQSPRTTSNQKRMRWNQVPGWQLACQRRVLLVATGRWQVAGHWRRTSRCILIKNGACWHCLLPNSQSLALVLAASG